MSAVSEEQLLEAVKALRITLLTFDEDAANNPKELLSRIKDDHPMWKKGLDEDGVSKALQKIKDAEIPEYVAPEATYPVELLWSGKAMKDLDIEHSKIIGIHHAQGGLGSKGSYILACKVDDSDRPGLMVLKESNPAFPAEVFASNVLRRMGLIAPKFRPLSLEEFRKLTWKLREVPVTIKGTCSAIHQSRAQESGGVLMNFLEGKILPECDPAALSNEKVLKDIGRCMVVDIVLNCLDRIPVVWHNNGNPTNILFAENEVHIIDNTYNRMTSKELAKKHVDKVHACAVEAKSGKLGSHAEAVRNFFSNSTGGNVKLTDEQMKIIFHSLSEACDELGKNHKEIFAAAAKETRDAFEKTRSSTKALLDEALNLDFCTACAEALLV